MFGVISSEIGIIHWHFGTSSFIAEDICEALKEVRAKLNDDVQIAMLWDNAKIHKANIVKDLMMSEEMKMESIWNVAQRPDLLTVGIE